MTTIFLGVDTTIGATSTAVYTTPSATQSIVFSGTIANIDDTNLADHSITLQVLRSGTYISLLHKVPIPYGSSLIVPRVALSFGENLVATADTAGCLVARLSIAERT